MTPGEFLIEPGQHRLNVDRRTCTVSTRESCATLAATSSVSTRTSGVPWETSAAARTSSAVSCSLPLTSISRTPRTGVKKTTTTRPTTAAKVPSTAHRRTR